MTIGFEELEALVAIMDQGSFRAAAEHMHKAQSSVSYAIKVLEKELELEIFDRSTYKPKLTDKGQVIYAKAKNILNMQNGLKETADFLNSGVEASLNIVTSVIFPQEKLQFMLIDFKKQFPRTRFSIDCGSFDYPLQKIQNGEADLIVAADYKNIEGLEKEFYGNIELVPVSSPNYRAADEGLSKRSFKSLTEVVVGAQSLTATKVKDGFVEEHETWHVSDYHFKKSIILDAIAWGFMPKEYVKDELKFGELVEMKAQNTQVIPLYIYRKKQEAYGPALQMLWQWLKSPK